MKKLITAILLVLALTGIAWAATDWACYFECTTKYGGGHNYCKRLCSY